MDEEKKVPDETTEDKARSDAFVEGSEEEETA